VANALLAAAASPGLPALVLPLYDPRLVWADRRRLRSDAPPQLALANSFLCPAGRWPGRGWVLLARADYGRIAGLYGTDFSLQIDDLVHPALNLKGLALVQGRCVTQGSPADPAAIYLVELTDHRGVLDNPWGQWPTSSQYNVVAPAYPGQYYSCSLNAGAAWTWDQMAGDLWGQMPLLGSYPGLPFAPAGTPENWAFPGEGCWDALVRVLDHAGLTLAADLTKASPYTIVRPGDADPAFTAAQTAYAGFLEEQYDYIDAGAGRVAGTVVVYFNRTNQYFGTEETVRKDAAQWQCRPFYQVSVAGPAPYAASPGKVAQWSDFSVRFDIDGNPLAADVTAAASVAQDVANAYYRRVTRGTAGYLRRLYAGVLPFAAGSQVDGVRWYQTDGRAAWRTELVRGPQPPWAQAVRITAEGE